MVHFFIVSQRYDKDENGELVINEKEAEIVRRIYREYLRGKNLQTIARGLTHEELFQQIRAQQQSVLRVLRSYF
ncbi:recombinase family protein [Paenibacillus elgii]